MADTKHTPKSDATPTSVYLFYDKDGVLLYVGITARGIARQGEHNSAKEWWPFVARQEVEHYPNRKHAAGRERGLIRRYRPPFNKQHNPDHEITRAAYLDFQERLRGSKASLAQVLHKGRSGERVLFDVKRTGDGYVLSSLPGDAAQLMGLDIMSAFRATIAVESVKGARGRVLRAWETPVGHSIHMAFAREIGIRPVAELMLRMPAPSQGMPGITVKRITLQKAR